MIRQNNPVLHQVERSFWEYVVKMDDGRPRCKFCGRLFPKATSIWRIKFHLAGVTGRGVRICGQVPKDVKDTALAAIAIDGPPPKKLKPVGGSSNNEFTNATSASAQQQNNEMMFDEWMASITVGDMELLERGSFHERPSFNQADEPRGDPSQPTNDQLCSPSVNNDATMNVAQNAVGVRTEPVVQVLEQSNAELDNLSVDAGRKQVGVQGMEQGGEEERICLRLDMENTSEGFTHHVDGNVSPCILTVDVNDNRREDTQIKDLVHHLAGEPWDQISTLLMEEVDVESNTGRFVQPGARASSSVGLKHNTSETRGVPLPTGSTKLVGRAFEENRNVIWSWLMDDEVSTIGIYGMGGAGKTTMLKHIYNELLRIADISHHVYWVTVSQDFSIHTLQKKIAKRIKLSLSNEEEELHIAAELSLELMKKQKWILILDDLWNSFELHEVGIPVSLKGCKLIMTTRSWIDGLPK